MSCKLEYKGKEYTEAELIKVLSQDSSIVDQYKDQEQRVYNTDGRTTESMDMTIRKIEHMKKLMNVEVILDNDVKTSRVLSATDPRTKAAGKPVILINPNAIFSDTVIHEFAHIFIDAFPGGLENKRLQKALKSLEGTELYDQVKALYPDLSQEMFEKELLATAIGMEGAVIFSDPKKATAFNSFKEWFFDFLKRTFGIEMDVVNSLTKELLTQTVKADLTENLSKEAQQQIIEKEIREEAIAADPELGTVDILYEQLQTRVINASRAYKPSTTEQKNEEFSRKQKNKKEGKGAITTYEQMLELNEALEAYKKTDKVRGIMEFVKWSEETINLLSFRLNADRKKDDPPLSAKTMMELEEFASVFDILRDIQIELDGNLDIKQGLKDKFNRNINKIRAAKSDFEVRLLSEEREWFAKEMANNDVESVVKAKNELAKKFKDLFPKGTDTDKNVYITQELEKMMPELRAASLEKYRKRSRESIGDISDSAFKFISEKQMGSDEISVASRVIDGQERKIADYSANEAGKMDVRNKAFSEEVSDSSNTSVKYEGMYDSSSKDGVYFAGEYNADFLDSEREAKDNAYNSDNYNEKYKDVVVNNDKSYEYEGYSKVLHIPGSTKMEVQGEHVSYVPKGEKEFTTISLRQAVGMSELYYWKQANTITVREGGVTKVLPSDGRAISNSGLNTIDHRNKSWATLDQRKKDELNFLKEKIEEGDDSTGGKSSLVHKSGSTKFIMLPAVEKQTAERVRQGDFKGAGKDYLSSMVLLKDDDYDTQKSFADSANREKFEIPIPFRNKLDLKKQSLDLHTIVLMNLMQTKNFELKKEVESQLLVMAEVMNNRLVPKTHGVARKAMMHKSYKDKDVMLHQPDQFVPNDVKKMYSMIENRIYGIKSIDAGDVAGLDVNKTVATALKYSGIVSLVGNWANSVVNYSVGSSINLLEAMSGEHFTLKDLKKAKSTYWKDSREIIKDIGSVVDSSRTNLFLNILNVMGDKTVINGRFSNTSKVEVLAEMNSLRPLAKMGEHMMQAQVMYSVMHNIKAQNAKGEFVDKNGKIVADKKDAADMNDVITFAKKDDGSVKMVIKDFVAGNSFSGAANHEVILQEMQALVKKKIMDLHGNYDSDVQADAQRSWWGKAMFFLRKWIEPGLFRRWRGISTFRKLNSELTDADKSFSADLKSNQEGYYVTAARFLYNVLPALVKKGNFDAIKKYSKGMESHEKANAKRMITEIAMITMLYVGYSLLNIEGDDDENLIAKYILRRQISEMTFFWNPAEAFKIVSTPTAGMGMVKNLIKLTSQGLTSPTERYLQGVNKGDLKISVFAKKLLPGVRDFEDIQKSFDFLNNSL